MGPSEVLNEMLAPLRGLPDFKTRLLTATAVPKVGSMVCLLFCPKWVLHPCKCGNTTHTVALVEVHRAHWHAEILILEGFTDVGFPADGGFGVTPHQAGMSGPCFPTAFAHFASRCDILVMLWIFQLFHSNYIYYGDLLRDR